MDFPSLLLKEEEEGILVHCLSSLDPCTFFFSVFHSLPSYQCCFVCQSSVLLLSSLEILWFFEHSKAAEEERGILAAVLSVYWPSCGLDSRLLGMARISCHCQWSVDYFQWNAFVIVIIVVARCCCCLCLYCRASWNLFNGKCIFQNTTRLHCSCRSSSISSSRNGLRGHCGIMVTFLQSNPLVCRDAFMDTVHWPLKTDLD